MPCYRGESHSHPNFPEGSKASSNLYISSSDEVKENIEYSTKDDKAIEQWIRGNIGSAFHPLGTCKMAPLEKLGVVDENLKVYGMQRLYIADMSVVPENVSGNTMSTALMIGEKAADIFIGELGLQA
jgi:choline dehydrogenase-like flavoprotein